MTARAHIGTSGWVYPWWREVFYPKGLPQRRWLEHYVQNFTTVEINATFYRLPKPATLDRWREAAPEGFVYALKASRQITHLARLADCVEALELFIAAARRLGPALGPVLFQLPPDFPADAGRIDGFARTLPEDLRCVFEFRDPSWFSDELFALLDDRGLAFCVHDHRGQPVPDRMTGGFAYYRFHGAGGDHATSYPEAALTQAAGAIRAAVTGGSDVYAYFNNDGGGCAVHDARSLMALVGGSGQIGRQAGQQ